jgi:hypothetical protein
MSEPPDTNAGEARRWLRQSGSGIPLAIAYRSASQA